MAVLRVVQFALVVRVEDVVPAEWSHERIGDEVGPVLVARAATEALRSLTEDAVVIRVSDGDGGWDEVVVGQRKG